MSITLAELSSRYNGNVLICPHCNAELQMPEITIRHIRTASDIATVLAPQMGTLELEEMRVVLLNAKNDVLRIVTPYTGNVSAALVRVGELFTEAIRLHAAGIILIHNHPSGDPTPSPDDLHMTAEVIAAGRLLDIDVLDHIVIGRDDWISMRDRGVAFNRQRQQTPEKA